MQKETLEQLTKSSLGEVTPCLSLPIKFQTGKWTMMDFFLNDEGKV